MASNLFNLYIEVLKKHKILIKSPYSSDNIIRIWASVYFNQIYISW